MWTIRDARDDDSPTILGILAQVFAEHGFVFAVDEEMPEMRRVDTVFRGHGGRFLVVEQMGAIVGFCGWIPSPAAAGDGLEMKRFYVDRRYRGQGLGTGLITAVESEAVRRRCRFIELWSDTRLLRAHALYERLGYRRQMNTRALNDLSASIEYHYLKWL